VFFLSGGLSFVSKKSGFATRGAVVAIGPFFTTHKDTISGLSFAAGLIGLTFTIYQISATNSTLQATNAYNIQKDARELITTLAKDPAFSEYVINFDPQKSYPPDIVRSANRNIGLLINFYLGVFRQYKAGGIAKSLAASFGNDFCDDIIKKVPPVARYFRELAADKRSEIKEMEDAWCP
jgi:hypothetical protein